MLTQSSASMVIYNQDKQNLALTYVKRKPLFFISMKHAAEKERERSQFCYKITMHTCTIIRWKLAMYYKHGSYCLMLSHTTKTVIEP